MDSFDLESFNNLIVKAKKYIAGAVFLLFPLFFLPVFRDAYSVSKNLLVIYSALVILVLDFFYLLLNRKMVWHKTNLDLPLYLFLFSALLSLVIMTPNKWQALFVSVEAYAVWVGWAVLLFTAVYTNLDTIRLALISAFFVAVNLFLSFVNVFSKIYLPEQLDFIKNNYFVITGSYLEALVLLGFVFLYLVFGYIFGSKKRSLRNNNLWQAVESISLIVCLIAIILGVYNILNPVEVNGEPFRLILPPFRTSWYAAVEILKAPLTAVFGVGINNFSSIFTQVKTIDYNLSDLWIVSSFNLSASFFLHILTTTGILGLASFIFYLSRLYQQLMIKSSRLVFLFYVLVFVFLILPVTPIALYLLFVLSAKAGGKTEKYEINFGEIPLVYISSIGVNLAFIFVSFYYTFKYTRAELYFYQGIRALNTNSAVDVFENHRRAIIEFPYLEALRRNFSQINMALAENYLNQLVEENKKDKPDEEAVTNLRNSLNQAIQASIDEAKAVRDLNYQKAENWAFLGGIYRNILNLAQNADAWAISSYQRAVQLDPLNPSYKIELGGLFYALQQYNDAERLFESAIASKPNWANGYYNLAWAAYQRKDFAKAVNAMQNVVSLLESDSKANKESLEKAKKELEEFKKQLSSEEGSATSEAGLQEQGQEQNQEQLQIPTPPQHEIDQKINLPESASPPDTTEDNQ